MTKTGRPVVLGAKPASSAAASLAVAHRGPRDRRRGRRRRTVAAPLTTADVRRLRRSFARLESQAGITGLVFYRVLFSLDRSLRPLFHTSVDLQARKFMESLRFTVESLENPRELVPALEALGRRHLSYGTRPEHYDTVREAVLRTLAEVLGLAFTPATSEAWQRALRLVSEIMQRGAAQSVPVDGSVVRDRCG